jgi:signal transduction histidine kinase
LVDIHETIDATLTVLHSKYKNLINIRKKYGDIPPVKCYPGKMGQVFMNLIDNAIFAIKSKDNITKDEEIVIRTGISDSKTNHITIEITDTGKGVPEEIRKHIFEPFYTTKEVGKGTGLGLSIVLGIIENHNGTVEVNNVDGKGARFYISLPVE